MQGMQVTFALSVVAFVLSQTIPQAVRCFSRTPGTGLPQGLLTFTR